MKISFFSQKRTWETEQVIQTAGERGIDLDFFCIDSVEGLESVREEMGDIIYWRSAGVNRYERQAFLKSLQEESAGKRHIVNSGNVQNCNIIYKTVQQEIVADASVCEGIPTFTFGGKEELLAATAETLQYPFICKPNYGARGEGVRLIKDESDITDDINYEKSIFQPFIKNTGDYRILVIGGNAIGAIKRVGQEGSVTNNISQGGVGLHVTDTEELQAVSSVAEAIAELFDLQIVGVDVMYDEEVKVYRFLELNTTQQWKGFQETTGTIVADILMDFFQQLDT